MAFAPGRRWDFDRHTRVCAQFVHAAVMAITTKSPAGGAGVGLLRGGRKRRRGAYGIGRRGRLGGVGWNDVAADAIEQARAMVVGGLAELKEHGLIDDAKAAAKRVRISSSLADALDGAGFVQENTLETIDCKRAMFSQISTDWRRPMRSSPPPPPPSSRASSLRASRDAIAAWWRIQSTRRIWCRSWNSFGRAMDSARDHRQGQGDLRSTRPGADRRQAQGTAGLHPKPFAGRVVVGGVSPRRRRLCHRSKISTRP